MRGSRRAFFMTAIAGTLTVAAGVAARSAEPCAVCAKAIVTNSALATCFLEDYERLAGRASGAIVVDLSDCETPRGIVERLHEAAERGLWEEPDAEVLAALQQVYLDVEGELEDR